MYPRKTPTLQQLRRVMLLTASAAALSIHLASSATAGGFTAEVEGTWLQHFGDELVYADFQDANAGTSNNQTIDRAKDLLVGAS